MTTTEILVENEVTIFNLAQIFKRAYLKTDIDEDGDLVVHTDGLRVIVTIDQDRTLLKYLVLYGIKEAGDLKLKYEFVNKMNDRFILGRFSIPETQPAVLIIDYFLPFDEGISAFQIVSALRHLTKLIPDAIASCDEYDLVE